MRTEDAEKNSADRLFNLAALEATLPQIHERYMSGVPFPHIVLDNFLSADAAQRGTEEFPRVQPKRWINFVHVNEQKYGNREPSSWGPSLQAVAEKLNSPCCVRFLSDLTGIEGLRADESMEGGGLHQSLPGGFLNIHADFTVHPHHRQWRRRVNLLLYFNGEWPPQYGGHTCGLVAALLHAQ